MPNDTDIYEKSRYIKFNSFSQPEKRVEEMSEVELIEHLYKTLGLDILITTKTVNTENDVNMAEYRRVAKKIIEKIRAEFVKKRTITDDPRFNGQIENYLHDLAFKKFDYI